MAATKITKAGERTLKKGDHVVVYQKPITREDEEGIAVLRDKALNGNRDFYPDGPNGKPFYLEFWNVRFSASEPVVSRWVSVRDLDND